MVLEGPDGLVLENSLIFRLKVSNNQAKYKALVAGLKLAKDVGTHCLKCQTD